MARQPRAEATRQRLLQATLEVLHDAGYAGTTTQAVCRRAGCSRGTLLYHFPTRELLLVAALHHVLQSRVAQFVAGVSAPMAPDAFVHMLATQWRDEAFTAWLELAVAARTNEALRAPLQETMLAFDQLIRDAFRTLVPHHTLPEPLAEQLPFLTFALLNGLGVGRSYERPGHADATLDAIAHLATLVVPGPIGGTPWKS